MRNGGFVYGVYMPLSTIFQLNHGGYIIQ